MKHIYTIALIVFISSNTSRANIEDFHNAIVDRNYSQAWQIASDADAKSELSRLLLYISSGPIRASLLGNLAETLTGAQYRATRWELLAQQAELEGDTALAEEHRAWIATLEVGRALAATLGSGTSHKPTVTLGGALPPPKRPGV